MFDGVGIAMEDFNAGQTGRPSASGNHVRRSTRRSDVQRLSIVATTSGASRAILCESPGRPARVLGYRCTQVLAYVTRMIEQENIVPSYLMIADELGISSKGKVCEMVKRLERRGLLRREPGCRQARRIRLG